MGNRVEANSHCPIATAIGFVWNLSRPLAGLTDHRWKLWPVGELTGDTLLTLISVFVLVDNAIAFQKTRMASHVGRMINRWRPQECLVLERRLWQWTIGDVMMPDGPPQPRVG